MDLDKKTKEKLSHLEELFFDEHPQGFESENLAKAAKRHSSKKRTEFAREAFSKERFSDPNQIVKDMATLVSRSSMLSMFEKPRFREMTERMGIEGKETLSIALDEMLHGNFEAGFCLMAEMLENGGIAKWALATIIPYYYDPKKHLFIKPTTTKNILKHFEIEGMKYTPKPNWEFYKGYKKFIFSLRKEADPKLKESNAKFTGFLMMGVEMAKEEQEILEKYNPGE